LHSGVRYTLAAVNYLAHLFLAGDSPELRIGGLLGDFLQGVDRRQYSEAIQRGIRLHHEVDVFADSHALFARSRNRLRPPYRRYAGVLVDIFYDHFLAVHWASFSRDPLPDFSRMVYETLTANEAILPPRLRRMLPHMVSEDWLTSYRAREGIDRTLRRLSRRLKRENPLPEAVCQLDEYYGELEQDFLGFFPRLIEFTQGRIEGLGKGDGPLARGA
jgi:acyl carrier protein phosphodiesterase